MTEVVHSTLINRLLEERKIKKTDKKG